MINIKQMSVGRMNEFSFINKIKQQNYKQSSLLKGIGDDTAVFRQTSQDIVTAVDTFVEHIHFSKKTMSPFHVGYRVLAVNLSDIAAMGAVPAFYLVSIVIPTSWSENELLEIYSGMENLANEYKMDLIGGDTVSGKELVISITVIGYVEKGKVRYRSSARDGDVVFVTGTLGDSQAGLYILTNKNEYSNQAYFISKHRKPIPRVNFAKKLSNITRMALNDISDGIVSEAAEIAVASNTSIVLYDHLLPVSTSFTQFPLKLQRKWKYFGGEDYELLGTVSKKDWGTVQHIGLKLDVDVTKVGYVEYNQDSIGKIFESDGKRRLHLKERGYTHLE